jgi:hypothetical protein
MVLTKRLKIFPSSAIRCQRSYLKVQQDILETFIDRGELRKLAQPTITSTGKRVPGLKLDNPRQLAVMHALVRFAHIAAANTFTTAEIHPLVIEARGCPPERYSLACLRYDLSKLRAKGLITRLPHSRRYQLSSQGYSISLVFFKLFERIYAPLTAGLVNPFRTDARLQHDRRTQLDRLYQCVADDLDALPHAHGGLGRVRVSVILNCGIDSFRISLSGRWRRNRCAWAASKSAILPAPNPIAAGQGARWTAVPRLWRVKGYTNTSFIAQDLLTHPHVINFRRERWQTPDGDMIAAPL